MTVQKYSVNLAGLVLVLLSQFLVAAYAKGQTVPRMMYIMPESENLRSIQNGPILGKLNQGTRVAVIEEQGNWIRVHVEGWIWKESLSSIKPADRSATYRAQMILVKTKLEADEILALIKGGGDFSELAQKRSIAPNAAKGGDLGLFNPQDFRPEFSIAIIELKVGEVSGVVETESGYAIFKRLK